MADVSTNCLSRPLFKLHQDKEALLGFITIVFLRSSTWRKTEILTDVDCRVCRLFVGK